MGIATAGRREQLSRTLLQLSEQVRGPDQVLVCPASPDDYDPSVEAQLPFAIARVTAPRRGSCAQRNAILDSVTGMDLIVFLDDDFYPSANYLAVIEHLFHVRRDVAASTNWPTLDGATGPGVTHEEALLALEEMPSGSPEELELNDTYGTYGCNMTFRLADVNELDLRFDETLPLYGWLEDIDFSRQLARRGRIVGCAQLRGVHLGTKRGRQSGVRIGYSQLANPYYLVRKGSVDIGYASRQAFRNVAKNIWRASRPEPWIDRRGRLYGNLLAVGDWFKGRLAPGRVRDL